MIRSRRLTVGQAIVRFIAHQFVERDGKENRFIDRISRPEQLLASLPEAFRVLTDPAETGAVTIALPEDVQAEAFDWPSEFFEKKVWHVRRPVPEPERIADFIQLLRAAERPL